MNSGVAALAANAWNRLAGEKNPFLSHAFLAALEHSGSVGRGTGWQPVPITMAGVDGALAGALPAYLKTHSQGEYVFDHSWADAWERAGGRYYPKLQIAVPFTPVPGPRLLAADLETAAALIAAAQGLVDEHGLSSAHATFVAPDQMALFRAAGWLVREGMQFHWADDGYGDFEGFLNSLASRKRKSIRKERAAAQAGLEIVHLSGADIRAQDWDAFWHFYQDTGARKWGTPYLTRAFFDEIGARMADRLLLIMAKRGGQPIAGALNIIGADTLYGRYWGCTEDVPFLHFELCYYQAIDAALARGLSRVEAGAQGEHKLARGYVPVPTFSAHYIPNPAFRRAIEEFLVRERAGMAHQREVLASFAPFRQQA
ncbi:MAG: GNAT family N-acetyltransferase [Alphaproteobacteria bacterium]|nr:GNAT family N-acetyltransferase [Alphaproteobacteria bacterium]